MTLQGVNWDGSHQKLIGTGFLPNLIESGGTCTLTLTKAGSPTASASIPGMANAQNTACGQMVIPRSALSAGTWTATLSYSSPLHRGVSASQTVKVTP